MKVENFAADTNIAFKNCAPLFKMLLINCKIYFELNWNNNCVIYGADDNADGNDRESTFK